MELRERIGNLLSDEKFQDEFFSLNKLSGDESELFKSRYSLSEEEFAYILKFYSGLSFQKPIGIESDANYAVSRFRVAINSLESDSGETSRLTILDWLFRVAAILAVPLLFSTLYFYQKSNSQNEQYSYVGKSDVINTFSAPLGAKTQLVLPDGTLVWLNSGSKLWCPPKFGAKSREVKLEGEAYFEVVTNKEVPMVISAGNIKVNVYGTKFNLSAYEDDNRIVTTLLEGKVTISNLKDGKVFNLAPGHSASYYQKSEKMSDEIVENFDYYIGWKDGKILFHGQDFGTMIRVFERMYGVDIRLHDSSLSKYTFHATFYDESIERIFEILSLSIPIKTEFSQRIRQADGSYSKREIIVERDFTRKLKYK